MLKIILLKVEQNLNKLYKIKFMHSRLEPHLVLVNCQNLQVVKCISTSIKTLYTNITLTLNNFLTIGFCKVVLQLCLC